jgi:hypothetical protein
MIRVYTECQHEYELMKEKLQGTGAYVCPPEKSIGALS